jgi:hypothetical protein
VAQWCRESGEPRGEVLPLGQVSELAQAWYGNRLSPDYRGRSVEQAVAIFEGLGLRSAFWSAGA